MTDLQALFETLEQLTPGDLEQVRQFVEERQDDLLRVSPAGQDVETRIAELHAALAEFREGLSEQELNDLVYAMTIKYSHPMKDLAMYDWIDDLPEAER